MEPKVGQEWHEDWDVGDITYDGPVKVVHVGPNVVVVVGPLNGAQVEQRIPKEKFLETYRRY